MRTIPLELTDSRMLTPATTMSWGRMGPTLCPSAGPTSSGKSYGEQHHQEKGGCQIKGIRWAEKQWGHFVLIFNSIHNQRCPEVHLKDTCQQMQKWLLGSWETRFYSQLLLSRVKNYVGVFDMMGRLKEKDWVFRWNSHLCEKGWKWLASCMVAQRSRTLLTFLGFLFSW